MSYNLRNKETGELIPIAGNGVGVAKFGAPVENWLTGHSSAATAITANNDGILYYFNYNGSTETPLIATLVVNGKSIRGTRTTGWSSCITLPIRKGDTVFAYEPLSGDQSIFYPFVENVIQPIEGGEEYSTDEKVIGTWIDGKPIYRTTIKLSSNMGNDSKFPVLNIDTMVDYGGTIYATASRYKRSFPWKLASYAFDINGWDSGGAHVYAMDSSVSSIIGSGSTVWFEYTKTTD